MYLGVIAQLVLHQSRDFLRSSAETAANGFVIPAELLTNEAELLASTGSLAYINRKKSAVRLDRFNEVRCRQFFSNNPEFSTLLETAIHGASIDVASNFIPIEVPEGFRVSHDSLQHTFSTHAYKFWQKSQGILLPTDVAVTLGVHFSPVHWTPKPNAPLGRFLVDLSNCTSGTPLNQPEAKTLVDVRYGIVSYPTIHDVVELLFAAADDFGWDNVVMWKDDIVGAFNQFSFSAESAKLLALRISSAATLVMFTGVFGWLGSPAVWAVFSRALTRLVATFIMYILLYVDDFIAFGHALRAHYEQRQLHIALNGVFGPGAVNPDKSILPSRTGDAIGWMIDIPNRRLYPNDKGCKNLQLYFSLATPPRFAQSKRYSAWVP